MKKTLFLIAMVLMASAQAVGKNALKSHDRIRPENIFDSVPEMSGGVYYAYPVVADSMPPLPEGYFPVYISHYGRHGSRWPMKPLIYKVASDYFQREQLKENVSTEGKGVWKLVSRCAADFQGHQGELTPMGERQQLDIARRMARRFPSLFGDDARIVARSSVEPRCIMSMAAFSEGIKKYNPALLIERYATPGDMDFIHHKDEDADLAASETAPWRWEFDDRRDALTKCPDAARRLFKEIPANDSLPIFMRALHDIAVSVQNIDSLHADILALFTPQELASLWTAGNYIQYVGNCHSPLVYSAGPLAARPLLREIVSRAEEILADGSVSADLRFGHDTDLMRLLALMRAEGCGAESEDSEEVAAVWRNYEISPMAANLQLIFCRDAKGHVIMAPRLNERPIAISDVPQEFPGYYDWDLLKIYLGEISE